MQGGRPPAAEPQIGLEVPNLASLDRMVVGERAVEQTVENLKFLGIEVPQGGVVRWAKRDIGVRVMKELAPALQELGTEPSTPSSLLLGPGKPANLPSGVRRSPAAAMENALAEAYGQVGSSYSKTSEQSVRFDDIEAGGCISPDHLVRQIT